MSKLPKAVFRCILNYCEPVMIKRVNEHYKYDARRPINFRWPKKLSYQNPIRGLKWSGWNL